MTNRLPFTLHATDGNARRGTLHTAHGPVETPVFMPVGTAATVKAMLPETVAQTGADIVLGNTYHLMLRPTAERIAKLGGLHHFMRWDKAILTDSGGFQVMSLAKIREISEEGVRFQSHLDGSSHMLSPERSMEIQHLLGSDITMIFDECTPFPASHQTARESMELSLRWAERSKQAYQPREGYGLFGIVQGSVYEDLRTASATALNQMEFDGMAIGGLAVGEGQAEMLRVLDFTVPQLPDDKPRYLMGVGKPDDLVEAVLRGVDMFDCVLPTRSGRNGQAFTWQGTINIRNARYADDPTPLDAGSTCPASRDYSKAYLHHLVKSNEILGAMLMTWHNVAFYQRLMQHMRDAISAGTLQEFAENFLRRYTKQ
ncbi:MAG: tRNA guanosine(34) transglycosylase Tgt [Hyphomicrobiales bacterium]|nr:tRNA guanosine(34) transglycosylase Tgt [Hyphomicrobiales bacterium]